LILCIFTLMSCTKEVKISQLVFNKSLTVAYYGEEPFSGKAWSEDNKTVCMTFEEGKVTLIKVFHANGKVAVEGTEFQGVGKTYDEQGNSIGLHEFVKAYPAIVNEVQHMATNVLYDESLK
jgi:hypothetical protein